MTAARFFTHPLGIIAASIGATLLWGSAYPFIKLSYAHLHIGSSETFEQLLFAGYRFTLAGCSFLSTCCFGERVFVISEAAVPR